MSHVIRKTIERDREGNITAVTELHTNDLGLAEDSAYRSLSLLERRLGEAACHAAAKGRRLQPEQLRLALIVNRHRLAT